MESSVLLRSMGMIRPVVGGAAARPSSGGCLVELRRIRVRALMVDSRAPLPRAEMRGFESVVKCSGKRMFSCSAQSSTPYSGDFVKPHPEVLEENGSVDDSASANENGSVDNQIPIQQPPQQNSAKIHDFCFGIPFGGTVLIIGIVSFSIARDVNTLCNSILFGGALLGLSTTSLKVWRRGKSSFSYILGQAVIAAILLWNSYQGYQLTKKIFPNAVYVAISVAMLCFYSYVVISGGNPPPKKLKPQA